MVLEMAVAFVLDVLSEIPVANYNTNIYLDRTVRVAQDVDDNVCDDNNKENRQDDGESKPEMAKMRQGVFSISLQRRLL